MCIRKETIKKTMRIAWNTLAETFKKCIQQCSKVKACAAFRCNNRLARCADTQKILRRIVLTEISSILIRFSNAKNMIFPVCWSPEYGALFFHRTTQNVRHLKILYTKQRNTPEPFVSCLSRAVRSNRTFVVQSPECLTHMIFTCELL